MDAAPWASDETRRRRQRWAGISSVAAMAAEFRVVHAEQFISTSKSEFPFPSVS